MEHLFATTAHHDAAFAPAANAALLMRVLDEIDYAMLLVAADSGLRYANQLALAEVVRDGPLRLAGGCIFARAPHDQQVLLEAIGDALRGRRNLITLEGAEGATSVAVLPLPADSFDAKGAVALLVFGKRRQCESLTIDFYARSHGLTSAETRVLHALCQGERPKEIALSTGVAISTVRTHVSSIRQKTRTDSIGDLMHRVTTLPPITSAIRPSGQGRIPAATSFAPPPVARRAEATAAVPA